MTVDIVEFEDKVGRANMLLEEAQNEAGELDSFIHGYLTGVCVSLDQLLAYLQEKYADQLED